MTPAQWAEQANELRPLIRADRRGPVLSAESPREELLQWLQACDPNGCWLDEDCEAEGWPPATLAEAWESVAAALSDVE